VAPVAVEPVPSTIIELDVEDDAPLPLAEPALVEDATPVVAAKPKVSQAVLRGMIEELTDAGVLTETERDEKLALLETLYR
jgi:hypothetical protein